MTAATIAAEARVDVDRVYFCDCCPSTRDVRRLDDGKVLCRHCRVLFAPIGEAAPDLGELESAPIYERVMQGEPEPEERVGEGPTEPTTSPSPSPDADDPREAANQEDDAAVSVAIPEKDETP